MQTDLAAGSPTSRYEALRVVGQGAFAVVYLARDRNLDREVALKVFRRDRSDEEALERFAREAGLLVRYPFPGLVGVLDLDFSGPSPFAVLEWMPGGDLAARIARGEPAPFRKVLQVGIRLARALAHLHDHDILHRDVKPENVLHDEAGEAALADLGLALVGDQEGLTQTGQVVGTPRYMAPEALALGEYSPRSDLFSLAAVLMECGAGRRFEGLALEGNQVPELGRSLPHAGLRQLLSRTLRREPGERPESAAALVREFERLLSASDSVAVPRPNAGDDPASAETLQLPGTALPSPGAARPAEERRRPREPRRSRRHAWRIPTFLGLVSVLAAGLWWGGGDASQPPASAPSPGPAERPHPAEEALRQAFERDLDRHRSANGSLRIIGRGGPYRQHLKEVLEAFGDPRATIRWSRILRRTIDWLRVVTRTATPGEGPVELRPRDEALLREGILPLVQHLRRDTRMVVGAQTTSLVGDWMSFPGGVPTAPPLEARAAMDRLEEIGDVVEESLGMLCPLASMPDLMLAARLILWYPSDDALAMVEELDRRYRSAPERVPDQWLLRGELALLPSYSGARSPIPCDVALARLPALRQRLERVSASLPPAERADLLLEALYCQLGLDVGCARLDAMERRDLVLEARRLLDEVQEFAPAAPAEVHAWSFWILRIQNVDMLRTHASRDPIVEEAKEEIWEGARHLARGALRTLRRRRAGRNPQAAATRGPMPATRR